MNKIVLYLLIIVTYICSQSVLVSDIKDTATICDYLVVTHQDFLEPSLALAEHRNAFTGDSVTNALVVLLSDVYDSFSIDGSSNAETLWRGLKWIHDNWQHPFSYIVLMGDDSLIIDKEVPSVISTGNMPSFIWDIKVMGNNVEFNSSDDVYTFLATDTIAFDQEMYSTPVYIGRIPCETVEQGQHYVDKVISFDTNRNYGTWRNRTLCVADDEVHKGDKDFIWHWGMTETVSEKVIPAYFNEKCYLSAFKLGDDSSHSIARGDFFEKINQGVLWTLVSAHGYPDGLTSENLVSTEHTSSFTNVNKPTIFCSFSCSNGRYFSRTKDSMLKNYLFTSTGGCLAYYASVQTSFANSNERMAKELFTHISLYQNCGLGKIIRMAKINKSDFGRYHLFGDPALTVTKPKAPLIFTPSINSPEVSTLQCDFNTPLSSMANYAYQISIPETTTVNQYGYVDVTFIKRSIIDADTGTFGGGFTINLPEANRTSLVHVRVYTWNNGFEQRKDTTFYLNVVSVSQDNKIQLFVKSQVKVLKNRLHIQLPESYSKSRTAIDIFSPNGKKVYSNPINNNTGKIILDLHRTNLAMGSYIIKIQVGNESVVKPFAFVK